MNDASSGGSSTNPVAAPTNDQDASPMGAGASSSNPLDQKKRVRKEMRTFFLDNLIRNLDIMIFCELSILYYME